MTRELAIEQSQELYLQTRGVSPREDSSLSVSKSFLSAVHTPDVGHTYPRLFDMKAYNPLALLTQ